MGRAGAASFCEEIEDKKRSGDAFHLAESLLFLPYGVAVDHFQHEVYRNPEASPAERHAMWQEMERTYLPWRDYGDLEHPARGGFWQTQRHIYLDGIVPGGISTSQWISLGLMATAVTLGLWLRSRARRMLVVAVNETRDSPAPVVDGGPEPAASQA